MEQLVIVKHFPSDIPHPDVDRLELGYIEPGHGLKDRKKWILDDDFEFLKRCEVKKTKLTFWCHSRESSKDKQGRDLTPPEESPVIRFSAFVITFTLAKLEEV